MLVGFSCVKLNLWVHALFQIISQESIMELGKTRDRSQQSDHMRALALSVFSQCRRLLVHTSSVKSLTGFGTAASLDQFLKGKDVSFPEPNLARATAANFFFLSRKRIEFRTSSTRRPTSWRRSRRKWNRSSRLASPARNRAACCISATAYPKTKVGCWPSSPTSGAKFSRLSQLISTYRTGAGGKRLRRDGSACRNSWTGR